MVELARRIGQWQAAGKDIALAFVVRTGDSSPRAAGSLMAVSSSGDIEGSVSAGCAEGAIVRAAFEAMETKRRAMVPFSSFADDWEIDAPCGGDLDVLVERYDARLHGFMMECVFAGVPFAYMTVLDDEGEPKAAVVSEAGCVTSGIDDGLVDAVFERMGWSFAGRGSSSSPYEGERSNAVQPFGGASAGTVEVSGCSVFACRYEMRPRIICVGAVHISACLAPMAQAAGYDTIVVDPRKAFLDEGRFPRDTRLVHGWPQAVFSSLGIGPHCAICALTHDEKIDVPALTEALRTDAFYIGCIGSAKTLAKRCASLVEEGVAPADFARVHGPIGLYVGGKTPGEIAVSILAQIQAVRFGRIGFAESMPGRTLADFAASPQVRGAA